MRLLEDAEWRYEEYVQKSERWVCCAVEWSGIGELSSDRPELIRVGLERTTSSVTIKRKEDFPRAIDDNDRTRSEEGNYS